MKAGSAFGVLYTEGALFLGIEHATHQSVPIEIRAFLVFLVLFLPPIFLWWDWVHFCDDLDDRAKDDAKHTHDLARNIWLALTVILIALFDMKDLI